LYIDIYIYGFSQSTSFNLATMTISTLSKHEFKSFNHLRISYKSCTNGISICRPTTDHSHGAVISQNHFELSTATFSAVMASFDN